MTCSIEAVGAMVSGVVRLGPLRLSAYGLCAALGLAGALWLSLRTARMVGVEPAEIWDAGLFALGAAFVISRLLLVVRNWTAFLHYPLLVLALPSLSYFGMSLTAVAVLLYLRRKRLPTLAVMDAWAPCAALLAGLLEIGHWLEGSDAGMPWLSGGKLVPVQLIGAGLSTLLMLYLLWMLVAKRRSGAVGGVGLTLGGLLAFVGAMVRQPVTAGGEWLETGQWIAIGAMIVGVVVLQAARETV
jgi:phosphatidylglycerol:prolipoprotein diacylglycerol transferase